MDQNDSKNPLPDHPNSKLISIVISAVLTILTVGFGVFYLVNLSEQEETVFLRNQIDLSKGSVLLAMKNKQQNPLPSNPENLLNEYIVVSYDPKIGQEEQLALIKNNFFVTPFGFANSKIFFETPHGELGGFDINSGKQETIKIPGIVPTGEYLNSNTLFDFLVSEGKIFYLKGHCSEGLYCALGEYDLSTGNNQIIVDSLDKQIKSMFSYTELVERDSTKNVLRIRVIGGDAGSVSVSLYELNLSTGVITKIDSARSIYCGENESDCTPQQKAENGKYDKLFSNPQVNCNGVAVNVFYDQVSIFGKNFDDTRYIGCVD